MIRSMTGYGMGRIETSDVVIQSEIKSLNSKYFDLSLRLPKVFSEKEMEVRALLQKELSRGKIFLSVGVEFTNPAKLKRTLNKELLKLYYEDIVDLADVLELKKDHLLKMLIDLPDAFEPPGEEEVEEGWKRVLQSIQTAIKQLDTFRKKEGQALQEELTNYVDRIKSTAGEVDEIKDERIDVLRERLERKIRELTQIQDLDANRLEQEVVYYAEKLDITEELVRIDGHYKHFLETLEESGSGKKLNFITQELGREINTIGSKGNDLGIQRKVVVMKDELEKIKEQVQNIL